MKKITLNLDDLKVESFDTTDEEGAVLGYDPISCPTCGQYTCDNTCGYSCGGTCQTCPASDCSCPPRACIGSSGGVPCP